ncbi:MAG: lipoyl(octanoyl) transferase LipB [Leptolyngbya sp. PLA3]|nr:MAG: lipoyl(octanoyl) transferase LipB [Cyanobacteria bacterium CYA]MCE7968073.1 lipoyl(octanoyl) transferase LipB [Leptolyngbya sp. PL-A3]
MSLEVIDLGRMAYHAAWDEQRRLHAEVLAARERGEPEIGRVLLVEHDPVITVTKRPGAIGHLLASPELLTRHGVELVHTDRGGDITYHGPGQLVCYPIIDLQLLHLRLHEYMRLLEQAVIDTIATFGLAGERDPSATGVWVRPNAGLPAEKICAMGVRVSRWISMHGLALNVTTNLDHFGLIVPCGLSGRGVTSLGALLGAACPAMESVKCELVSAIRRLLKRD